MVALQPRSTELLYRKKAYLVLLTSAARRYSVGIQRSQAVNHRDVLLLVNLVTIQLRAILCPVTLIRTVVSRPQEFEAGAFVLIIDEFLVRLRRRYAYEMLSGLSLRHSFGYC